MIKGDPDESLSVDILWLIILFVISKIVPEPWDNSWDNSPEEYFNINISLFFNESLWLIIFSSIILKNLFILSVSKISIHA